MCIIYLDYQDYNMCSDVYVSKLVSYNTTLLQTHVCENLLSPKRSLLKILTYFVFIIKMKRDNERMTQAAGND